MKPPLETGATSHSCSCTSCMHTSESDWNSIRRFIPVGRIDKLYNDKDIPLREQILLERLVRTRAVYDDIRAQLLSESDLSNKGKPYLKPRKHVRPKQWASSARNSTFSELVNLDGKVKVSGGNKLSDCCSCCSCGSVYTHAHQSRRRRHRHARDSRDGDAHSITRTSTLRKKMKRIKKSVSFKTKSIRSAPCTCVSEISSMIIRRSQEIITWLRPEDTRPTLELIEQGIYEENIGKKKYKKNIQNTYHIMKKSKSRLMQSMGEGVKKVRESKTKLKKHMKTQGKKSLEKIKQAHHKVNENVKAAFQKSIQRRQSPTEELYFEEIDFPIKKDSVTKFKERLQREKRHDDYACEPVCIPDECVPESCFRIIKLRRVKREKEGENIKANVINIDVISNAPNEAEKAHQKDTAMTKELSRNQKNLKRIRPPAKQRISVDVGSKKIGNKTRITITKSPKVKEKLNVSYCACEEVHSQVPPKEKNTVEPTANLPPTSIKPEKDHQESSYFGIEINKGKIPPDQINKKKRKQSQNFKLDSALEKVSPTDLQHSRTESRAGNRALKRCVCILKLKAKEKKLNPIKSIPRNTTTETQSVTLTQMLDHENAGKQLQTKCLNPLSVECNTDITRHKARAAGVSVKPLQKSVSSLTSKSLSAGSIMVSTQKDVKKSRNLDQLTENASEKRVLRIGSTFSCNIEFYKDKRKKAPFALTQDMAIEDQGKQLNKSKIKRLRHRHSEISSSTGKSKNTLTKHRRLRRCFCTLKLAHANRMKIKPKTRSEESAATTHPSNVTFNVNKAITTNKEYKLASFKYRPGKRESGECDFNLCKKRVRYMKHPTKQSNTDSRRTKSSLSVTMRSMPKIPIYVYTQTKSTTATYLSSGQQHKDEGKSLRQIRTTPSSPERRVVRVGSSLSFNIELHKDNNKISRIPTDDVPKERPPNSSKSPSKQLKEQSCEANVKKHQRSTSMLAKKKNRCSFIAPAMKRCLCTLKLHKNKQKTAISHTTIGTGTQNYNTVDDKNIMLTKGTKTKSEKHKFGFAFESYECEPNVCVPGECDPYECLKRIQMRQVRDSGTLTEKTQIKSAASITSQSQLQSKGALAKPKYKAKKIARNAGNESNVDFEQKSRLQAVRLGSNFSFNVEFRKELVSPSTIIRNSIKDVKEVPKILKHKGKENYRRSMQQGKKYRKPTNIQAPKVITVSRVTVTETKITDSKILPSKITNQESNSITALSNRNLSKPRMESQYKVMKSYFNNQKSINSLPCYMLVPSNITFPPFRHLKGSAKCESSEYSLSICPIKGNTSVRNRKNTFKYKAKRNASEQQQDVKIVGYSQISRPPAQHKLKPYECEPGVCEPYECDPYECEKLIKKRLMRTVDRMSGTNVQSKSISSLASESKSHLKTESMQSRPARREKVQKMPVGGIKYVSEPTRKNKQAVRVGSSFSFNIEFAKEKSKPVKFAPNKPLKTLQRSRPSKPPKKVIKAKGTKRYAVGHHDQDSQSVIFTENKGSSMKPMMQRCFCTLKLQKKGKHQKVEKIKPVQQATDKGTRTPPNTLNDYVASRTMLNAGQNTTKPYKLLPYECEPQVCVPGECDPYECLERIKKRNKTLRDSGTGAMRYRTTSSSNTRQRGRSEARHVQSKPRRQNKTTESTTPRLSNVTNVEKPSRQDVRIGSSFSFNVDFFKESSETSPSPKHVVQREFRPPVKHEKTPKQKNIKKKMKAVGMQDDIHLRHTKSQIGNVINQVKSTMTTSLLKRCFCTAKLHEKTKPPKERKVKPMQSISVNSSASQANETNSFLKRCFCALKFKKAKKNTNQINTHASTNTIVVCAPPTHVDKKVVTVPYRSRLRNLEPYECEPGICVPGECNPYECDKLIRARNIKLDTRGAFTEKPKTRSTSSSMMSSTASKAQKTQSIFNASNSSRPQPSYIAKESPSSIERIRSSPNRQVVRIGSNFSFNIEFYKDRSPNAEEVQAAAKAIKHKPEPRPKLKTHKTGKERKNKHQGIVVNSVETVDHESQADKAKVRDQASGIAHALKRCFCTLKLRKGYIPKDPEYTTQKTGTGAIKEMPTHQTRAVMTKRKTKKLKPYECEPHVCIPYECNPYECDKLIKIRNLKDTTKGAMTSGIEKPLGYKLLPYECEPNFCIPGQCDPYECEKRIKMRNIKHRSSGTSTKMYRGKSIASDIRPTISKARKVQSPKTHHRNIRTKPVSSKPFRSIKSFDSTRQSVKIGSGFSFDVEFYKNKSLSRPEIVPIRSVKQRANRTKSISASAQKSMVLMRDSEMQYRRPMRDTDSQSLAQRMQDTGVNPFLKRCFCTLKLQKSGEMAAKYAIGKATRDKTVYLATLLPYECEPGICVPGECDPYECEKRIRRRNMRNQLTGTAKRNRDSSTSSDSAKYRAAKIQAMRDAQARKHQTSTCATRDCRQIRRPTTTSESSSRQAIRMGSSFKFDVEFYKDNSAKLDTRPRTYSKPSKIKEHTKTQPMKTSRSKSVTSSGIRRQHNKAQTKGTRTESKSTGFGPLLKRCFCTLSLNKNKLPPPPPPPPVPKTKATYRNDDLSDLYQFSRNIGVGTGRRFHKLKPYECEPNVCIPGQCDPYECYERIKRRLKDSGAGAASPITKSGYSQYSASNPKRKSINTQCIGDRPCRERPSMTQTLRKHTRKASVPKYSGSGETTRQAVKFGSNISFSIEFFKDGPNSVQIPKAVRKIKDFDTSPKKCKTCTTSPSRKPYASTLSQDAKEGYNRVCQADCIKNVSRGTTMGNMKKRCFCTLNLLKNQPTAVPKLPLVSKVSKAKKAPPPPITTLNLHNNPTNKARKLSSVSKEPKSKKPPSPPILTTQAVAQTKRKYLAKEAVPFKLKPYECEPNFCVPGECNPYECLERIKMRNIRRYSRRIGTHTRPSQVSVSSMASRLEPRTSRCVQSCPRRSRRVSQPQQVPRVVEEPRFTHMFEKGNRTAVKLGSNINFNIEFYKDKKQTPIFDDRAYHDYKPNEPKCKPICRNSMFSQSSPKGIQKGTGDKSCDRRTCEAQADGAIMKDKAAGVSNKLKRCFCTLKLQKNPAQLITVNRVTVEEDYRKSYERAKGERNNSKRNPSSLLLSSNREYYGYSPNILMNYFNERKSPKHRSYLLNHATHFNDSKEMKTLYPYSPAKFHKRESRTVLLRDSEIRNRSLFRKSDEVNQSFTMKTARPRRHSKYIRKNSTKQGQTKDKGEESIYKKTCRKMFVQNLFARIFSKRKSEEKETTERCPNQPCRNFNIVKPDSLKFSKSDRRPPDINKPLSTKTPSLKATRVSGQRRRTKCQINNYKKPNNLFDLCGDTGQENLKINRKVSKAPSTQYCNVNKSLNRKMTNKTIMPNVRSPFESDKVVQMAIIKSKGKKKGKHTMANTTTNTQTKITHTKNIETINDPNANPNLLEKCKCFFKKVLSIKDDTTMKIGRVRSRNDRNETKLLSSGDYHTNPQMDNLKKSKAKKNRPKTNKVSFADENQQYRSECNKCLSDIHKKNRLSPDYQSKPLKSNVKNANVKKWRPKRRGVKCMNKIKDERRLLSYGDDQANQQKRNMQNTNAKKWRPKNKKTCLLLSPDAYQTKHQEYHVDNKRTESIHPSLNECPCDRNKKRLMEDNVKASSGDAKQQQQAIKTAPGKKPYGAKLTIKAKGGMGPGQIRPGQMPSGQMRLGQMGLGQLGLGQMRLGQLGLGQIRLGQKLIGKILPGELHPEQKTKTDTPKPCVCGTKICDKEVKKAELKKKQKEYIPKPCICGSKPCARAAKRRKGKKPPEKACDCAEELKRIEIAKKKKEEALRQWKKTEKALLKRFQAEDKARKAQRFRDELYAERQADKFRNASSGLLAAESALDVVKVLYHSITDMARVASRAVLHPQLTYNQLDYIRRHPRRGIAAVGDALQGSGFSSTARVMRKRCAGMKCFKKAVNVLEGNVVTNYLLHATDKDPSKRLKFKKKKQFRRKHEPIDFECSLFMASLRRRPCLAVYYTCPWFYPHCLSMLTLWKQFTDVMLFLIAVTVWSPCILAMELCRAFVCCFFCTG